MPRSAFFAINPRYPSAFQDASLCVCVDGLHLRRTGRLLRVNASNAPAAGEGGTTWLCNCDRVGNILSKSCHRYTTGTPGVAIMAALIKPVILPALREVPMLRSDTVGLFVLFLRRSPCSPSCVQGYHQKAPCCQALTFSLVNAALRLLL